jgi:acyl dehydratase
MQGSYRPPLVSHPLREGGSVSETGGPRRIGPFDTRIDEAFVHAYAEATCDDSQGSTPPPLAIATRIFEAQLAGMEALIPGSVRQPATGGVHGEHDVVLYRPVVTGEPLMTFVEPYSARPFRDNVRVVFRHLTVDGSQRPVAEQLWTTVLLGTTCHPYGPVPPGHSFPEDARDRPLSSYVIPLGEDMPQRYAEVSRDFSPHHFEPEAARRSGYDSVFLHGLCTMGLCAQAAVRTVAGGDSGRIRRVAVRFASPAFLDHDLEVQFYEAGAATFAFEAFCAGARVISNGLVELKSTPPTTPSL